MMLVVMLFTCMQESFLSLVYHEICYRVINFIQS